jgi:hypothetical protein
LQQLRVEIDSLLSGALKLQEREFQVLPEAWEKLDEAHALVSWLVLPMQEYPNLDRLTQPQLEEFLVASELIETQKEELRSSPNKTTTYIECRLLVSTTQSKKDMFGSTELRRTERNFLSI